MQNFSLSFTLSALYCPCQSLVWSLIHVWSPPSSGPVTPPSHTRHTHLSPHLFCVWLHGLLFHFCTMFVASSDTGVIAFLPLLSLCCFFLMLSLCFALCLPLSAGEVLFQMAEVHRQIQIQLEEMVSVALCCCSGWSEREPPDWFGVWRSFASGATCSVSVASV